MTCIMYRIQVETICYSICSMLKHALLVHPEGSNASTYHCQSWSKYVKGNKKSLAVLKPGGGMHKKGRMKVNPQLCK